MRVSWFLAAGSIVVLVFFLSGCSKPGYQVGMGGVKFNRKDFNGRMVSHTLDKVDKASFEILNQYYARDKSQVFYKGRLIQDCDPKSVELMGEGTLYCKDSSRVYLETKTFSDDAANFEHAGGGYSKDSNKVYFLGTVVEGAKPKSWHSYSDKGPIGKDDEAAYHEGKTIAGADLPSFQALNYNYSKDKNSVWYRTKLMEGADADSFQVPDLKSRTGEDKSHRYNEGEIVDSSNRPDLGGKSN